MWYLPTPVFDLTTFCDRNLILYRTNKTHLNLVQKPRNHTIRSREKITRERERWLITFVIALTYQSKFLPKLNELYSLSE